MTHTATDKIITRHIALVYMLHANNIEKKILQTQWVYGSIILFIRVTGLILSDKK